MAQCNINSLKEKYPLIDSLMKEAGDLKLASERLTSVFQTDKDGNVSLTKEFDDWFKQTYPNKKFDFNSKDNKEAIDVLKHYFGKDAFNVTASAKKNNSELKGDYKLYNSEQDREDSIHLIKNNILKNIAEDEVKGRRPWIKKDKNGKIVETNKISYYTNDIKQSLLLDNIAREIGIKGNTRKELLQNLLKASSGTHYMVYIQKRINEIGSRTLRNQFAVLVEMGRNPEYIKRIFDQSELRNLGKSAQELEAEASEKTMDLEDIGEGDTIEDLGQAVAEHYSDVEKRSGVDLASAELKRYFATIPRQNITDVTRTEGTVNIVRSDLRDNALGFKEYMDANKIISTLYQLRGKDSPEELIKSIRFYADNVPEMAGMAKIADDMAINKDLRNKIYNLANSDVIAKTEAVRDNQESLKMIRSNRKSDRNLIVFDSLSRNIREAAQHTDINYNRDALSTISAMKNRGTVKAAIIEILSAKDLDKNGNPKKSKLPSKAFEDAHDYINSITDLFRSYFPYITQTSLESYLRSDPITKLQVIEDALRQTFDACEEIIESKDTKQDLPKKAIAVVDDLAKEFTDYTAFTGTVDSINAENKRGTDVDKNSAVSTFDKILASQAAAEVWGKEQAAFDESTMHAENYAFAYSQLYARDGAGDNKYRLFHRDEANNIVKTSARLFAISQFSGAKRFDNQNGKTYSKMSMGDYIASSLIAYFDTYRPLGMDKAYDGNYASYFLRTPSDAPKNYLITMRKYSFNGNNGDLIKIDNEDEINAILNNTVKDTLNVLDKTSLSDILKEEGQTIYNKTISDDGAYRPMINDTQVESLLNGNSITLELTNNNVKFITNTKGLGLHNDDEATFIVRNGFDKDDNQSFVVKGKFNEAANRFENVEYRGVWNDGKRTKISSKTIDSIRENKYRELIYDNKVKRTVNTNHEIMRPFRDAFMSDLANMYGSAQKFFNTDKEGNIKIFADDGTVNIREEFKDDLVTFKKGDKTFVALKDPLKCHGYDGYEGKLDKKTGYFILMQDGKLVGDVYKSLKFDVFDGESKYSYGTDALKEAFRLEEGDSLRGGFNTKGEFILNLTDAQKSAIDKAIQGFILDESDRAYDLISEYKQFYDKPIDRKMAAEFILNNNVADFLMDELFEGDVKQYGSTQKFLKRAKESQAGGTSYGNIDYTKTLKELEEEDLKAANDESFAKYIVDTKIQDSPFKAFDENGNAVDFRVRDQQTFKAVTVRNTIINANLDDYIDAHPKYDAPIDNKNLETMAAAIAKNSKISIEEGRKKIIRVHKGFKANDAQSFITYEEWIRRIARQGRLNEFRELINEINDRSKPVNGELLAKLNTFVQVQKNYYYDRVYDDTNHTMMSRQIKNAEFVLIPRFIEGTELEEVYNIMTRRGIDQLNTVETSKASKNDILNIWDDNGEGVYITPKKQKDGTMISDFEQSIVANPSVKHTYDYRRLYKQLDVPQHTDTDTKISVQVVKKIIDNIPEWETDDKGNFVYAKDSKGEFIKDSSTGGLVRKHHPLWIAKQEFLNSYSQKITNSFVDLCDRLDIKTDDEGHMLNTEGKPFKDGDKLDVNYDLLLKRAREEAMRQGYDSNLEAFFKKADIKDNDFLPDEITEAPLYLSNKGLKTQSVFNAIFNSAITRQKMNGFHATQVTGIGMNPIGKVRSSTKLRYHIDENGNYTNDIQIAITYKAFGIDVNSEHYQKLYKEAEDLAREELNPMTNAVEKLKKSGKVIVKEGKKKDTTQPPVERNIDPKTLRIRTKEIFDAKIIEELHEEGLDRAVIYRNPNEGKQSSAIGKIAYFLDDAYGSTIVVPDEWVAQTGSDFDVDSIYGLQNYYRKDKNGQVRRIRFRENNHSLSRYARYLSDKIDAKVHADDVRGQIKQEIEKYKENYSAKWQQINNELSDLFGKLGNNATDIVRKNNINTKTIQQNHDDTVAALKKYLENNSKTVQAKERAKINRYIDKFDELANYAAEAKSVINEKTGKIREEVHDAAIKKLNEVALKHGVKTYDEWDKLSDLQKASSKEVGNHMLDQLMTLLGAPESTEENLSASNFDDITNARAIIFGSDSTKEAMDAFSGKLTDKEVSGIADRYKDRNANRSAYNFLDQAFFMNNVMSGARLKAASVTRDTFMSVCNTVKPRLGKLYTVNVDYGDGNVIAHDKFGWTDNYHNDKGYIGTSYSSETSAFAFDAVKEGQIDNVNDFTFPAYKLFPELGIGYDVAVSFILQNGIKRIVDKYNEGNSIFSEGYSNPIEDSIKDLAKEMGVTSINGRDIQYTSINSIMDYLNKQYGSYFHDRFGCDITLNIVELKDTKFDLREQIDHIKNPTDDKLYDLYTIMQFNKLNTIAQNILDRARVVNPDKTGSKVDIASNIIQKETIDKLREADNKAEHGPILTSGDPNAPSILDKIYPLDRGVESSYKTLDTFYNSTLVPSVEIVSPLYKTQNKNFRNTVLGLTKAFDIRRPTIHMTNDDYNAYERYIVGGAYNRISTMAIPQRIILDENGNTKGFEDAIDPSKMTLQEQQKERGRIFGISNRNDFKVEDKDGNIKEFTVKDYWKPTEEELREFEQFSPALKVAYIKQHSADPGVFNYFDTEIGRRFGSRTEKAKQTITYRDGTVDKEIVYRRFMEAINNDNPLIASAALDLVKYAMVAEGMEIHSGVINPALSMDVLTKKLPGKPDTIVDELNAKIDEADGSSGDYLRDYVRSHSDDPKLPRVQGSYAEKYEDYFGTIDSNGMPSKIKRTSQKVGRYTIRTFSDKAKNKLKIDDGAIKIPFDPYALRTFKLINDKWNDDDVIEEVTTKDKNNKEIVSNRLSNKVLDVLYENYKNQNYDTIFDIVPINRFLVIDFKGTDAKNNPYSKSKVYETLITEDGVWLIPLTKLGRNEHGDMSIDPDNNEGVPYIREHYIGKLLQPKDAEPIDPELLKSQKIRNDLTVRGNMSTLRDFDLNIPGEGEGEAFKSIRDQIKDMISNGKAHGSIYAPILKKYIDYGRVNGKGDQLIAIDENGTTTYHRVEIFRDKEAFGVDKAVETRGNSRYKRNKDYVEAHKNVQEAKNSTYTVLDRGVVSDNNNNPYAGLKSTTLETNQAGVAALKVASMKGDKDAKDALDKLTKKGFHSNERDSYELYQSDIADTTYAWVKRTVDNLNDRINNFMEDPDHKEQKLLITSKKVIDKLSQDENLRNEFLDVILSSKQLIDDLSIYDSVDVSTAGDQDKEVYKNIQNELNRLKTNPYLNQAFILFGNQYLKKLSTDPRIREGYLDVLNGYYSTSFLDAAIDDIQNTGNSATQIIIKHVMSNIYAQNMQGKKLVANFNKTVKGIIEEAAKHGITLQTKDVIDKYGRLIKDYSKRYVDDYNSLNNAVFDARSKYGTHSIQAQRASLAFDEWKADNVEQPLIPEYYHQKNALKKKLLDTAPEIAEKYEALLSERSRLLNERNLTSIDDALETKIDKINKQLKELSRIDSIYNPAKTYTDNPDLVDNIYVFQLSKDPVTRKKQLSESRQQKNALNSFINDIQALHMKAWTVNGTDDFRTILKEKLNIINKKEVRNQYGSLILSKSELFKNDPEYRDAITWLRQNAREVPSEFLNADNDIPSSMISGFGYGTFKEDIEKLGGAKGWYQYGGLKNAVTHAFEILKNGYTSKTFNLRHFMESKGAVLEDGSYDARKLTDEEIANIKDQQQREYNHTNSQVNKKGKMFYDGLAMISSSSYRGSNHVYTSEFYDGISVGGIRAHNHIKKVHEYNDFVRSFYDSDKQIIKTWEMSEEELDKLQALQIELNGEKSKIGTNKAHRDKAFAFRAKYMDENAINRQAYETAREYAKIRGDEYFKKWIEVNGDEDTPNEMLYGAFKPKKEFEDKFIDKEKTDAINLLKEVYEKEVTEAFTEKVNEIKDKDYARGANGKLVEQWFKDNTIFNPRTHKIEPLRCWLRTSYRRDNIETQYEPKGDFVTRTPKLDYENKKYNKIQENHKDWYIGDYYRDNNGKYANEIQLSEYHKELRDTIDGMIRGYLTSRKGQRAYKYGLLPAMTKEDLSSKGITKAIIGEIGNWLGVYGITPKLMTTNPSYNNDGPDIPLMNFIKTTGKMDKLQEDPLEKPQLPTLQNEENMREYYGKLADYNRKLQERKNAELEERSKNISNEWDKVFNNFQIEMINYNAIQSNKPMLEYLRRALEMPNKYKRNESTMTFVKDKQNNGYQMEVDKNLQSQFDTFYRRLLLDEWKKPEAASMAKLLQFAQGFTSSKYMMLNPRGGIANVFTGEMNIMQEVAGRTLFGRKEWAQGVADYMTGVYDYISNAYSEKSSTLAGGLIKFFQVVDFDELNGIVEIQSKTKYLNRLRNGMFLTNNAGEHIMQNSVMFSMLHSMKLMPNVQSDGQTKYRAMTVSDYIMAKECENIKKYIPTDKIKEFEKYEEEIRKDPQKLKRYNWFRGDLVTDFVTQFIDANRWKEIANSRREVRAKARKEFNAVKGDLYNEFDLGEDGQIRFKRGGILDKLDKTKSKGSNLSDAYKICGDFKERVINVNKKIHGNYDKMSRAYIEVYALGSLAMQYHKHIYPGLLKVFRRQGAYSEARGTVDKGSLVALKDFLSIPFNKFKNLPEDERQALTGLQNLFGAYTEFFHHARSVYRMLPDYEQANIRRNAGYAGGLLTSFMGILAFRLLQDTGDKNNVAFNWALYQFDRLGNETAELLPQGLFGNFKTLWSQPIAAMSACDDIISTMGEICGFLFDGADYDGVYKTGIHAGETKWKVFVKRNIPIFRQWDSITNLPKNNKAYKIGDSNAKFFGIDPKKVAELLKD